jgi:FkbM family methyltransferase
MRDLLGNLLRVTPPFRGKWRLRKFWERTLAASDFRVAFLPDGSIVKVQLDIPYERMVWLQDEEWDELRYLHHKLHPGDVFIDVGANIGLWTLVAASSVGPCGRVFSFEPNPATFDKLAENIRLNKKDTVIEVFQEAVSKDEDVVSFVCDPQHNLSAISSCGLEGQDVIKVRTRALDFLLANELAATHLAGIKLDTEGHELNALEGAAGLLEKRSPWLIVEFNTTLLTSNVLEAWPVYRFLLERRYLPFIYDNHGDETNVDGTLKVHGYRNILFKRIG